MAKIHIKSEKLTPFGGIFPIMEQFDTLLSKTITTVHENLLTLQKSNNLIVIHQNLGRVADILKLADF